VRVRALHLRAILLPLGVALASIAAVGWYGLVKIPAQQRYITDRSLRLQQSSTGLELAHVDSLRDPTRPSPADSFQLLRTSTRTTSR
jgi:hypothetical protein